MTETTLDFEDIQGNILHPYDLDHVRYLGLRIDDAARCREWLRQMAPAVTTATTASSRVACNLAFSHAGLRALGVDRASLDSFPKEFREGMGARAATLCDVGESDPANWDAPLGSSDVHLLIILHAESTADRDQRTISLRERLDEIGGASVLFTQDGSRFPGERRRREHFGYVDGISQPDVAGSARPAPAGHGAPERDGRTWRPIAPGAFLLGHPDEHGGVAQSPAPAALRMNGTYFVLRKLEQDVVAFRRYLEENAHVVGGDPELLAAKLVGRYRSGAPLALAPSGDDPDLGADPLRNNDFRYADEPEGLRCPRSAHIRRANPRDEFQRHRLSAQNDQPVVNVDAHRIIRRSVPYGPWLEEGARADGVRRGILFGAFNASIGEQFELIQSHWLNRGNSSGAPSGAVDPLVGAAPPAAAGDLTQGFRIPSPSGCAALADIPRFVTVRGGEYFFMPGVRALGVLSQEPPHKPAPLSGDGRSFLETWRALATAPGLRPAELAAKQKMLVLGSLSKLADVCRELRAGVPILATPLGVLVTKFQDAREVLSTNGVFSVRLSGEKMADVSGPFMLGMDDSARYHLEASIARLVIRRDDLPRIRAAAARIADASIRAAAARGGRIDVVQELTNRAPIRTMGEYFGVPGPSDALMLDWLQMTSLHLFNFWSTPEVKGHAVKVDLKILSYLDELIATRRAELKAGRPGPDDVLGRMLTVPTDIARGLDDVGIRRMLAGMFSGSIVPATALCVRVVQRLMDLRSSDPEHFTALQRAARGDDLETVGQYVTEAARFSAFPSFLNRYCEEDYLLARGTGRATMIPKGSPVIVVFSSAMLDEEAIDAPDEFRLGRPGWQNLIFGHGMHYCLGSFIGQALMVEVVRALFRQPGLRRARGPAGEVQYGAPGALPAQFYAQHLVLEFDR